MCDGIRIKIFVESTWISKWLLQSIWYHPESTWIEYDRMGIQPTIQWSFDNDEPWGIYHWIWGVEEIEASSPVLDDL